ncbi:hypothetical protein KC865_04925 [Candidatus Kaiserbacteria bacterium]|nr:hypothetical protein [Candidatus Kaiserbacteria bacterium]USN92142.1 MAG: hypothetical protein H6782_04690 [Candidatus Nomurabacteria bacterium]
MQNALQQQYQLPVRSSEHQPGLKLVPQLEEKLFPFISLRYKNEEDLIEVYILNDLQIANYFKEKYFEIRKHYYLEKHQDWEKVNFDYYDSSNYSTYLVLVLNGKVVGGCRVIHSDRLPKGKKLPVQEAVDLVPAGSVELSRFCIDIRGQSKTMRERLLRILSLGVLQWTFCEGYRYVYAMIYVCLHIRLKSFVATEKISDKIFSHGKNKFEAVKIDYLASFKNNLC